MALIIDNATRLGRENALANVAGLCTATYFHGALSILGISALILNHKPLFIIIKILGALYLLSMGFKAIKSGFENIKKFNANQNYSNNNTYINEKNTFKKVRLSTSYRDGFMTQILNPKVSIFYIAAFPKFLSGGGGIKRGFELVSIHSFNIFAWFTFLTIFISLANDILLNPRVKGYINICTGIVLSLFALFISFE